MFIFFVFAQTLQRCFLLRTYESQIAAPHTVDGVTGITVENSSVYLRWKVSSQSHRSGLLYLFGGLSNDEKHGVVLLVTPFHLWHSSAWKYWKVGLLRSQWRPRYAGSRRRWMVASGSTGQVGNIVQGSLIQGPPAVLFYRERRRY